MALSTDKTSLPAHPLGAHHEVGAEHSSTNPKLVSNDPSKAPGQWGKPLLMDGKSWFQMRNGAEVAAFKTELKQIVAMGRDFIRQNAATGSSMKAALNGLEAFESSKVDCFSASRAQVTFGINRQNLARFVGLLHDTSIPMDVRVGAAVELFGSLGTCPEGEALRIEEQTAKLGNFGKGLSTRYKETKEQLINQALSQLVTQEYSWQPNFNKLEIHHVNALRNLHAGAWGLRYHEDRYSRRMVQDQCGSMAKELVDATVTPGKISGLLTDQIRDVCMSNLGVPDSFNDEGLPTFKYKQDKIDLLDSGLKAEFGDSINLNDLLEFSDDYTEVTLKDPRDIQRIVLSKMQGEGVVPRNTPVTKLIEQHTPTVDDALRDIKHQYTSTGTSTPAQIYRQSVAANSGAGSTTNIANALVSPADKRREEEREKQIAANSSSGRGAPLSETQRAEQREGAPPRVQQNPAPDPEPKSSKLENKNPAESIQKQSTNSPQ